MRWWQSGVLYQIYPRSFQDGNGDGVGDIPGIVARLPYLSELGVDALWLSPVFVSPMADFGYDIADYCAIDPLFGTLNDFDVLVAAAHARGIKVLLDLVPNHTSIEHPWFKQSHRARTNDKRDWYIWRDPAPDGGPPNNWLSEFGGSAWTFDEMTGHYYYHAFLPAQPDLNWRNSDVRAAMHDVMRFWLRRGVDGFRVDVIWHLIKDDQFRDNPPNPDYRDGEPPYRRQLPLYSSDRPEVHEVIRGLRGVVDEFPQRVLIGEVYLPIDKLVAYYGRNLGGAHLPFNFSLLETPWQAAEMARLIERYEAALPEGAWPNWVLGNHDRPRVASRIGAAQSRVAAMLLLTLRGTPTLYYGDELGIRQGTVPPEQARDPVADVAGTGASRDGCRTPMQWDATRFAGFSTVPPWLPLQEDFGTLNVACEGEEPGSSLNLYRALIALRRAHPALSRGSYRPVASNDDVLVYAREAGADRMMVALNFSGRPAVVALPPKTSGTAILSTHGPIHRGNRLGDALIGTLSLAADEGIIFALDP